MRQSPASHRASGACARRLHAIAVAAVTALAACGGDGPPPAEVERAGGVITLFTDSTELFMEHPALIVGAPGTFAVHLTDLTDFAPLRSGRVTLRFTPRGGGAPLVVVQDAPRAPGIYGPRPEFARAGTYDLTILVESPQARDSIAVPGLTVYATEADAPLASEEDDDGISFLKEQQWKTDGFRTAFPVAGTIRAALEVPGEVEAVAGRLVVVAAPIGGVMDVAAVAQAPAPGERVTRGQVLARLTPALGDAGAAYADARARLREAEDEHARAQRLVAAEAAPTRRVHEAGIRLAAAREALAGLGGGALGDDGRLEIVAPIAGTVTERHVVPGGRVDAGTPLFTIVDASALWLTAHVPAADAARVARGAPATFTVEGDAAVRTTGRLRAVGSTIDATTRSVRVTYEVGNRDGAIRVGALARVAVTTDASLTGLLVPDAAILEEDGRPFVYVQSGGETFVRRDITTGGTDGVRTVVRSGLTATDRVVTGAAYQVKLASLSTAVPTHGHEH
jgi:RND family efflux transporter MFP subunit